MKPNNDNVSVVPYAAEWEERQRHEEIMAKIGTVRGFRDVDYSGPYVTWREITLPLNELKEIMARDRHDEILYLINRYNSAVSYEDQQQAKRPCYLSLPEEIQEMIAQRNNKEEMDAYLSCQGFGEKGQNVVLARGDHDEILAYVARHGLLPEQQRALLMRANEEEIFVHISCHGLADELIDEMFTEFELNGEFGFFYDFIEHHELPVFAQKKMLELMPGWSVLDYFNRYGLWNEAHASLLEFCDEEVIVTYFQKHHYLCPSAEDVLATIPNLEKRERLVRAYIRYWKDGSFKQGDHFLSALLLDARNNRDAIAEVLLVIPYTQNFLHDEAKSDFMLIKNGSDEELTKRFEEDVLLHVQALAELFFERDSELFFAYIDKCEKGNYYFW